MSADEISEKLFQKMSASRRRPFAPSKEKDKDGDGLWEAYLDAVEDQDKASVESWNGSTTGILTFTGLFAATVAAFVIESYKMLQADSGAQTVALLAQLVAASNSTPVVPASEILSGPFLAPDMAVIVNSLWFLSLVISLICALLATLIQEWTRDFLRDIQRRSPDVTIKTYALNHIYVRMGVETFKLDHVASIIVALMHVAVVLFLVGLAMFLHPINNAPANVVEAAGIVAAFIYVVFSIIPLFNNSCPYRTPLTYVFVYLGWVSFLALWAVFLAATLALSLVIGLPLLVLFSPIIACFAIGAISGIASDEDMSEFWSGLTMMSYGLIGLWTFSLGLMRLLMHAWYPSRRLPGHKEISVKILADYHEYDLFDKAAEEERFFNDGRLLFLWEYTSEYLMSSEGGAALLDYIPRRLLNPDSCSYDLLFVYLRHNHAFVNHFVRSMHSIDSMDKGLGMLKLLQRVISAEHGLEYQIEPSRDLRWTVLCHYNLPQHIPGFIRMMLAFDPSLDRAVGSIGLLISLSELRWTLVLVRFQLLSKMDEDDWKQNMGFLNQMLLALESIKGFALMPLYVDSRDLSDECLDKHGGDILWGYELSVQNALTLLVNLIYLDRDDALDEDRLKAAMPHWPRELSTAKKLKEFSEASRRRQPSSQLLSLFLSQNHKYGPVLAQFRELFTLPNPHPPELFRLELDAERTLRDIEIVYPRDSADGSRSHSPPHESGVTLVQSEGGIQVAPTATESETLGIGGIIEHTSSLNGVRLLPTPSEPDADVNAPGDIHGASGRPEVTTFPISAPELRVPFPSGHEGSEQDVRVSDVAPDSEIEENAPNNPSLRSAEEGTLGRENLANTTT